MPVRQERQHRLLKRTNMATEGREENSQTPPKQGNRADSGNLRQQTTQEEIPELVASDRSQYNSGFRPAQDRNEPVLPQPGRPRWGQMKSQAATNLYN